MRDLDVGSDGVADATRMLMLLVQGMVIASGRDQGTTGRRRE